MFDPRQPVTWRVSSAEWADWMDSLIDLVRPSPEWSSLEPPAELTIYELLLMLHGVRSPGFVLADLTAPVVLDLVQMALPSVEELRGEDAAQVVRELRAFFRFGARAFELPHFLDCAAAMTGAVAVDLAARLRDPELFGFAPEVSGDGQSWSEERARAATTLLNMMEEHPELFTPESMAAFAARGELASGLTPEERRKRKEAKKRRKESQRRNRR